MSKTFDVVEETCPHCDHFAEYKNMAFGWAKCRVCGRMIKLCSACPLDLDDWNCSTDCPLGKETDEQAGV